MKIKSNWNEVTISEYQEIYNINSENDLERDVAIISILTDKDTEEIRKANLSDIFECRDIIKKYISNQPDADFNTTFILDGVTYGFIPDLNYISTGEWLDNENWKNEPVDNLHLYAAMLFRPVTYVDGDYYTIEEYKIEGFMRRAELFRNRISINKVFGAQVFFSLFALEYTTSIAAYLTGTEKVEKKKRKRKMTTQQPLRKATKKRSTKPGDGMI